MKLSVVIVNYNVKYYLAQCLHSLYKALEGIEAEVFVVDNHSRDGSVPYLRSRFPSVHFIASSHNLGFSRGNNIALRQCTGEYVLLLNPDTVVGEEVIRSSVAFMDGHPSAGAHGVQMLDDRGRRALESRRGLPSPLVAFYKMMGLCRRFPHHEVFAHYYMGGLSWDVPGRIEVVSGAYCFLRRSALEQVGLLDEDFFMYGEDIDLSYRLLKAGYENWYLPVQILHYKGESTQKSSFRYVHVFYDAMLVFFRKHYGGMNVLWRLPVRAAIYVTAFGSLAKATLDVVRRKMGFRNSATAAYPYYIFVGGEQMVRCCRQLAADNALSGEYRQAGREVLTTLHAGLAEAQQGQDRPVCIVYDGGLFSCQDVLQAFSRHPSDNVHIGFYHVRENCIITMNEVIGGT
jgi:glycosyltransferase, group 2 family